MLRGRYSPLLVLVFVAIQAYPGQDLSPEVLLLARFKQKIRQDLSHVPNYTCLETIDRSQRANRARSFQPIGTLRLEVSKVGAQELFAYPGTAQFEDSDLKKFITHGAISNGMFELAAHEIFVSDNAMFEHIGNENIDGRRAVRYDYRIAQLLSGFTLMSGNGSAIVGSHGSFWFDPASLDLIRLTRFAVDIPASLGISGAAMTISYGRTQVGISSALLPRRAEIVVTSTSSQTDRNQIEFSRCREYQTESVVHFEEIPPAAIAPPNAPAPAVELPAGLLVPMVLETALDSKTSAVGDPVHARVEKDVRQHGQLLLPADAVISGRVRRLERSAAAEPYFVIGIELVEVAWDDHHADFYGELVDTGARKGVTAGYGTRGSVTYIVRSKAFHLDPGLSLLWRLLPRPPGDH
jgi:hypothetical protein